MRGSILLSIEVTWMRTSWTKKKAGKSFNIYLELDFILLSFAFRLN